MRGAGHHHPLPPRWLMTAAVGLTLLAGASVCMAAELRALQIRGPSARCMDLVIVAEGYTAGQQEVFEEDAKKAAEGVLGYGPYAALSGLVNVHALFVASQEQGADHPSTGELASTAFDASYDTGGIKRLLTANEGKVLAAVTQAFPDWDLALVLVNDPEYGGSGGPVPVVSVHEQAIAILRHELAHVVGGVADEYEAPYPGKIVEDPEPNVALKANLSPLKWAHWVKEGTPIPTSIDAQTGAHEPVGAYEGARYQATGMFRPTPTCIMRELNAGFCPVCWEAVTLGMAKHVVAVRAGYPDTPLVVCERGACPSLAVDATGAHALQVRWSVDGVVVADRHATWWYPGQLQTGLHDVSAEVFHAGPMVRKPKQGAGVGGWKWQVLVREPSAVTAVNDEDPAPAQSGCAVGPARSTAAWWLLVATMGAIAALARAARTETRCE